MPKNCFNNENELIEGLRQSQVYKEFRSKYLQHKIDREKAAWQVLNENRGQYTMQILNHIFDTVDQKQQNKKHWFGSLLAAPNRNLIFGSEISLINHWIDQLLFSGQEAEISLNTCLKKYKIKGASKGLATLLLYLSNPDLYNIWVNSTQNGLSFLGRIGDLKGQDWGENYTKFNNAAIEFRKKLELLPQEVDWVLSNLVCNAKKGANHLAASGETSTFQTDLQTSLVRETLTERNKNMNNNDELEFETPREEEVEVIEVPPDKRKIYTELGDPEIDSLHGKFKRGKLIVQPDFQRQYVWDKTKASRLIESALLGIPIPIIYISQEMDNKEYIIDGQQRLTSFFSFLDDKFPDSTDFKLTGLKVFGELNGQKYINLSEDIQDSIRYFKVRTITFKKDSDQNLRFEIFERLNTGAVALNDQELRNCIYRGSFNALLKELSQDTDFKYLLGLKKPDKRMKDIELVLRFSAFYHRTYLNYKPPMKNFLNAEAEEYIDITRDDAQRLKTAFKNTCQIIRSMLGKNAFKRFYKGTEKNPSGYWEPNKFNASLYDILMSTLAREEKNVIYQNLDSIRESLIHLMTENQDFIDSIELSTSSVQAVTKRFDLWRLALQDISGIGKKEPRYFSMQLKEALFKNDNTCAICNQKIREVDDSAIDHIKQYWTGGQTIPENARLTHRYCNWARSRKE